MLSHEKKIILLSYHTRSLEHILGKQFLQIQCICISGVPEGHLCICKCPSPSWWTAMTSLVFVLSLQLLMFEQDTALNAVVPSLLLSHRYLKTALEQGPLVHPLHLSLVQQTVMHLFYNKVKFQVQNESTPSLHNSIVSE